jgi:catechol 2,3-dioxygenase-like lactoylglutathione lyase family enzyme
MTVRRMHHLGVVVEDLPAAVAFFGALGLEVEGEWSAGVDDRLDRVVGLDGVQSDMAMVRTPDGHSRLELIRFRAPDGPGGDARAPAHAPGLRHVAFVVEDLDATIERLRPHGAELVGAVERYGDTYRLCYVRGPAGIIVELAETGG